MTVKLKRFAKKSLSGLFAPSNEEAASSLDGTLRQSGESVSSALEEFGKFEQSPGKDSPSRRLRLMGSMRKLKSSFDLSKATSCSELPVPTEHTPLRPDRQRTSLILDFEVSPPGIAMFTPEHTKSTIDIPRSSPITIPASARECNTESVCVTPPAESSFNVGTLPRSPAPLQESGVKGSIVNESSHKICHSPESYSVGPDPNPTPMPGTHFSLQLDQTPEIIVSPASSTSKEPADYFSTMKDDRLDNTAPLYSRDTACPQHFHPGVSAGAMATSNGGVPSDSTLPKRSDSGDTSMYSCSANPKIRQDIRASEADTISSLENDVDVSAYLALGAAQEDNEVQGGPGRRRSTWSRHTGLYDGTGYDFGDETIPEPPLHRDEGLFAADEERARIITEAIERSIRDIDAASKIPLPRVTDVEESDDEYARKIAAEIKDSLQDDNIEVEVQFDPDDTAVLDPLSPLLEFDECFIDNREALQDIIRAYAFSPEVVEDETEMEQARELENGSGDDEDISAYECSEGMEKVDRDVKLSLRITNRSLGG